MWLNADSTVCLVVWGPWKSTWIIANNSSFCGSHLHARPRTKNSLVICQWWVAMSESRARALLSSGCLETCFSNWRTASLAFAHKADANSRSYTISKTLKTSIKHLQLFHTRLKTLSEPIQTSPKPSKNLKNTSNLSKKLKKIKTDPRTSQTNPKLPMCVCSSL